LQMAGTELFGKVSLHVRIDITHSGGFNNRDLDNEIKAILDACNKVVWVDDRWVDSITATRKRGDIDCVEVEIWENCNDTILTRTPPTSVGG